MKKQENECMKKHREEYEARQAAKRREPIYRLGLENQNLMNQILEKIESINEKLTLALEELKITNNE